MVALAVGMACAAGWAQGGGAAPPPGAGQAATDPAYAAGYNAGYALGQQDQQAGRAANAHKFRVYQDGSAGYSDGYGTPEAYRSSFQSGFDDGYGDGFAGRERSVAADAAPAATSAGADVSKMARGNGYREGYNIGQSDANSNAVYNATASREYQQATVGYTPGLGASDAYQREFRSGFSTGYDDGFNHRLFNTALGTRPSDLAVATSGAATAGGNDLPTDPERAAARPSGVYDNGLLVAEGTQLQTTLDQPLDTQNSYAGEAFSVTVAVPVWVGAVAAIPAGSTIQGTVKQVTRGGKLSGHAQLQLEYNTLTLPGQAPLALNATTAAVGAAAEKVDPNEGTVNGQGAHTGKHAATGAAIGAVLGGIFGGGGGLIRGGIAGAAAGTAGVLISHKKDLALRQGEAMTLRLERPLELPAARGGGN